MRTIDLAVRLIRELLLVFMLLPFLSIGQESPYYGNYTREKELSEIQADTARIFKMINDAAAITDSSSGSTIRLLNNALSESRKINFVDGIAHAYVGLGVCYINKGDYATAEKYYYKAYPYAYHAIFHKNLPVILYNCLGTLNAFRSRYDLATKFYYKALDDIKLKKLSEPFMESMICGNLGLIWMRQGQYDQAAYYLKRSIETAARKKLYKNLGRSYVTLGGVYIDQKDYANGRAYSEQGLRLSTIYKDSMSQYCALLNLGISYQVTDRKKALSFFEKAISFRLANPYYSSIDPYIGIGTLYYQSGNPALAKKYLLAAVKNAEEKNLREGQQGAGKILALIYAAEKDFASAYKYQQLYSVIRDSLMDISQITANHQLEVKYRTAEKDKEIALNKLQMIHKDNIVRRKNSWLLGLGLGCLTFAALLVCLFMMTRHRQRMQKEKIRNLMQEQEISQLKAMITGEEKERTRMGRELHDGIGGLLAAFAVSFKEIGKENEVITRAPSYKRASGLLEEISGELRKTSHNMMPEILLHHSLPEAVRQFCDYMQNSRGKDLQIDTPYYGTFESLHPDLKLSVYRIVQELVQNVIKHANATHAIVQLILRDHILNLTVEDNGVGFEAGQERDGMGLLNLQSRIQSMNGHMSVTSEKGKGTSIFVEFDLQLREIV